MIGPRYAKALRDLAQDRRRAAIVFLALVVGIWGLTSVLAATTILKRELRDNFLTTTPPSMVLWLRGAGDVDGLLRAHPGVADAEQRDLAVLRVWVGDDAWLPILVFVVEDFEDLRISTMTLETGRLPQTGELLLERDGLPLLRGGGVPLEDLVVKRPGHERIPVRVSGLVHDPGQAPSHMDHRLYGYVSRATATQLGLQFDTQRVLATVAAQPDEASAIRELAKTLRPWLEGRGVEWVRVEVPPPLRHPHQGQLESLLFLLLGLGGLAFGLSGVLIVSMFSSLLTRQAHEIGVMKAIGGRTAQLIGPYAAMVMVPTALALTVALPLGLYSAGLYAQLAAAELNFDLLTPGPVLWVYPVIVGLSFALPLVAAAGPIWRGTGRTVRDALAPATVQEPWGSNRLATLKSRTLALALRNALRNPARTAATASALALGVACLGVGLHTGASLEATLGASARARAHDVDLVFAEPVARPRIAAILETTGGVVDYAVLWGGRASLEGPDGPSEPFDVRRPEHPPSLPLSMGNWQGLVANQELMSRLPELKLGQRVSLRLPDGTALDLKLSGVVQQIGPPRGYLPALDTDTQQVIAVEVHTSKHEIPAQRAVLRDLERQMEAAGIPVQAGSSKDQSLQVLQDHLIVITTVLVILSLFVLGVGGLGLASTMTIGLLERRRELAVMRAIGATASQLMRLVAIEGMAIGALAWALGAGASIPIGWMVASRFGLLIVDAPLHFTVSWLGLVGSGLGVLGFTSVVSAVPTWSVSQGTVYDGLRYE